VSLDPEDWSKFRAVAREMLDAAIDRLEHASDGRVWTPLPAAMKAGLRAPLPRAGRGVAKTARAAAELLPYGVGNTHPRFFGWVHGAGSPGGIIAGIAEAAMNANLGGRDHGAIYLEKQVVEWCRQIMGMPGGSSGLIVSGTSMATIVALKCARDATLGFASRAKGVQGGALVGYASEQAHSCVARAFDMLGLGSEALRLVAADDAYEMDLDALQAAVAADRAAGLRPFVVVGTAGSVNVGSIDDLEAIADFARAEGLWFHVDGAFGAAGMLSKRLRPRLSGITRADSLAFDFHKWLQVNYDAGCVLVRDEEVQRRAFSLRPDYLAGDARGLAAGSPWPVDYGPELSRGFRALKIWFQLNEHGTEGLGAMIDHTLDLAQELAGRVKASDKLELMAPVASCICCFRHRTKGAPEAVDALNQEIVLRLQEEGTAVPSTTRLYGRLAIRVNITNHRTRSEDIVLLVDEVLRLGAALGG